MQEIENTKNEFDFVYKSVNEKFLPILYNKIDTNLNLLKAIEQIFDELINKKTESKYDFDNKLEIELEKIKKKSISSFTKDFHDYNVEIENHCKSVPFIHSQKQELERYEISETDIFIVKIIKFIKRSLLQTALKDKNKANFFQKIWKSIFKYQKYWLQKIPIQNLNKYYFLHRQAASFHQNHHSEENYLLKQREVTGSRLILDI